MYRVIIFGAIGFSFALTLSYFSSGFQEEDRCVPSELLELVAERTDSNLGFSLSIVNVSDQDQEFVFPLDAYPYPPFSVKVLPGSGYSKDALGGSGWWNLAIISSKLYQMDELEGLHEVKVLKPNEGFVWEGNIGRFFGLFEGNKFTGKLRVRFKFISLTMSNPPVEGFELISGLLEFDEAEQVYD